MQSLPGRKRTLRLSARRSCFRRGLRSLPAALLLLGFFLLPGTAGAETSGRIEMVELTGVIDPVTSRFLVREIEEASQRSSHVLIVRLDTPGGLDVSMREMVQKILNADIPIVVWVAPSGARAGSAGVFLTYASHVAAMAPGTNIGAAHPVNLTGEDPEGAAAEKATNDAAAYLRSIARQRNRNVEFAERAVRESASLEADEAVAQDVADFLASGQRDLLQKLDGRRVDLGDRSVTLQTRNRPVEIHEMPFLERILHSVVRPEVAYLLLLLGFYGLLFELYSPGLGLGGILGAVSLILAFYSLSVLPVSWAGVALIALAVALFVADLFVAGVGVLTAGGVAALVAGSLLLFSDASPALRLSPVTIAAATGTTVIFFVFVLGAVLRARGSKPLSGAESMIGVAGIARSPLAPDGQVLARGTIWEATSAGGDIPQGAGVIVTEVRGLRLVVVPAGHPAEQVEKT